MKDGMRKIYLGELDVRNLDLNSRVNSKNAQLFETSNSFLPSKF